MKRRTFLKLLLPGCLLTVGCFRKGFSDASGESEVLQKIQKLQDRWVEAYNTGDFCRVEALFEPDCTFASDSISGGLEKLKRMLHVMRRRYEKQCLIPIGFQSRTTKFSGDIGWTLLQVQGKAGKQQIGSLTLVARQSRQSWRIVHYHFSK